MIAPNLTIKDGLYKAFDITNKQKCFWRQRGILKTQYITGGLIFRLKNFVRQLKRTQNG